MSSHHSQVVVGFDFSHSGNAAFYRALALAARAPFHILHFVCVLDSQGSLPALRRQGPIDYQFAERAQRAIADLVELELRSAKTSDRVQFFAHARIGKAADELLAVAREVGADLIIVGTKGLTGIERFVLGSVAERVVREAGCPVEVARNKTYEHVDLLDMKEVEPHHNYVPPHRYTYEDRRVLLRPVEWPLL